MGYGSRGGGGGGGGGCCGGDGDGDGGGSSSVGFIIFISSRQMRATAGAEHITHARAGVETRKNQVHHVRGVWRKRLHLLLLLLLLLRLLPLRCITSEEHVPGRGPQGRTEVGVVNLPSASLREDGKPHSQRVPWTSLIRAAMTQKDGDQHTIDTALVCNGVD